MYPMLGQFVLESSRNIRKYSCFHNQRHSFSVPNWEVGLMILRIVLFCKMVKDELILAKY